MGEQAHALDRRIVDAALEGVVVIDNDLRITYANEAAARAFGVPAANLVGRDVLGIALPLMSPADRAVVLERLTDLEREPGRYEITLHRADGSVGTYLVSGTVLRSADGTVDGSVALLTDITGRQVVERQFRLMAENATDVITVVDVSGRLTYVSASAKEVFGYTAEELVGSTFEQHLLAGHGPVQARVFVDSDEQPDLYTTTVQFVRADGRAIWAELTVRRIRDESTSAVVEYQASARDVTDRVDALAALHDSERRLQLVVDQLPAVVITMDKDLRLHSSAGAGLRIHGIRPNTSAGRTMYEVVEAAGRTGDPMLGYYEQAATGSDVSFETEWNGREYLMHASPLRDDDGDIIGVIGISSDVTEWKAVEQRYRLLAENSTDVISTIDPSGVYTFVSPSAAEVYGYQPEEMTGRRVEQFLDPDDQGGVRELFDDVGGQPDVFTTKVRFRRADGITIWVESTVRQVRDGSTGSVVELEASSRDISERRRMQEENTRVKNEFFATVSHELRTPLTSMIGYGELMADLEELSPQGQRFLSVILRSAERELRLVDDLLTLVAIEESGLTIRSAQLDLERVVSEAVEAARPRAEEARLDLSLETPGIAVPMYGDRDRLGQAMDNLLSNAIKFTPADGQVKVVVRSQGASAEIDVVDTGVGIGVADPDSLFEWLFRTPDAVAQETPGLGLGLTIAAAIVEAHAGTIEVVSSGPGGTSFRMTFPLRRSGSSDRS